MSIVLPRAVMPDADFLREVRVSYATGANGCAYLMMGHPEAHERRGTSIDRHLRGIAVGLGLREGEGYPPTPRLLYYAWGAWALDYGHPETLLALPRPPHGWATRAQGDRAAHIGVCLDPALPPSTPDRVLTGTVGYKADRRLGLIH
ncbi:hypothetical protein MTF65_11420 [Streptomyces sp. APSN-46.1]|uniref:hypothetical protein n=1 Tax=Streptomyces sp. APSN-46.1 TaxID=2929049 RepID=UPI001FB21784|nr:hypothetical protein [Streptomyces sp. APSN-46.1]MCJ1677942.1 hypothetical protein [Streptomyces sp. APSN-46.1]